MVAEWRRAGPRDSRLAAAAEIRGNRTSFAVAIAHHIVLGGLWETWRNHTASCSVIVTEANATIQLIHNRMPVVFADEIFAAWLDPQNNELVGLAALLQPSAPQDGPLRRSRNR